MARISIYTHIVIRQALKKIKGTLLVNKRWMTKPTIIVEKHYRKWGSLSFEVLGPPVMLVQLCGMCCHLLSAVMPDHVLGISCFPFYFLFIEVIKQLLVYSCTVTSVQFVLFVLLYSTNVHQCTNKPAAQPQQSHDQV